MASVNFLKKPCELAKSSQHVLKRLLKISPDNAGLYDSVTLGFSPFAILYDFIVYEASICIAIQDLVLARFNLLFPAYSKIEVKTAPETEPPRPWFGAPVVSLLFNISLVQTARPQPEKVSLAKEEQPFLTLQKPETPEVLQKAVQRPASEPEHEVKPKIIEEQIEEPRYRMLLPEIVAIQRQLMSRLAPILEAESSAVLESRRRMIPETLVSLGARTALPYESISEKVEALHIAVPEERMGRVSIPKSTLEATKEEPTRKERVASMEKIGKVIVPPLSLEEVKEGPPKSELPPTLPSPAVGAKVAPGLPELMAYVFRLPMLMRESQKPSVIALAAFMPLTSQTEPSTDISTALGVSPAEPATIGIGLKKTSLPPISLVARILPPTFESLRQLVELPVTALTIQRLLADTLTQRIASPEDLPSIGAETAKSRTSREIDMKAEILSKLQITRALARAEKTLTEELKYEPPAFVEELQKITAMYGRHMFDLAASGPIRATMLDQLAPGVLVPSKAEEYLPEESASPEAKESLAFPLQPSTSTRLAHVFPEEESINVNVFTETSDEDLRELERKVGRILSEQLANLGTMESLRANLVGESAFGLGGASAPGLSALDSHAVPSSLLRQVNVSEGTINLKVFTEAAGEDLRVLERKIHRILAAQISRYYGSSKP